MLFSLGNLAQLASNQPAPVTSAPSGHATGAAGGEGSGLIDIRSMANAYLGGGAGAAKATASAGIGSIDDLPVFSGGGFAEPAVFVPTARPANNNKVLYAMIGAVGLLAVVAVILVVVLFRSGGKEVVAVAAPGSASTEPGAATAPPPVPAAGNSVAATPPAPGSDTSATPPAGSGTQVATNDKPPPPPTPAPTPPPADTHKATPPPAPVHHTTPAPSTPPSHAVAAASPTPPAPKPEKPAPAAAGGDCDEVGCLLNNNEGACCAKFKKGGKAKPAASGGGDAPAAASNLPDTLDRDMISGGVAKVKARVMACGDKSPAKGQVKVHVKVAGSGAVSSVSVSATPDPALGNCVAAAMQKASFPKTQNGGSFGYPFVF